MAEGEGINVTKDDPVEAVKEFMSYAKWTFSILSEESDYFAAKVAFGDDFPMVGCLIELYVDQDQLVVHFLYGEEIDPERIGLVGEFVNRANNGMKIGNFEIDLDEREVTYKSSLCFAGAGLSTVLVYDTIMVALDSAEPYSAAYLKVSGGELGPAAAIAEVEGVDG